MLLSAILGAGEFMSRNELVEAYLVGKISRRGFMRGMAATGASLTMAAAAADQLRVSAQDNGADDGDPYGPYESPSKEPKTGGGGTTGGGGGATTLPDTGVGQDSKSGMLTPIALAASAAAAAVAFRVRQFRKPAESDLE
jgi:hypothetical protein